MRRILLLLIAFLLIGVVAAQDDPPDTGVWVTTQDYSSLRTGPSTAFDRLAVIDPAVTLPAIGRSADAGWVQVVYNGQRGWIARRLLVWSGDLSRLPVDGIDPNPFVRRQFVQAVTTRETPIYRQWVDPSDQVGTLPRGTTVEAIGRLGSRYIQILHDDQQYWVSGFNLRLFDPNFFELLDNNYLYSYGRLSATINRDIGGGLDLLLDVTDYWNALNNGRVINCRELPEYLGARLTSNADVRSEPIFEPVVQALDTARAQTNNALALLETLCNRNTFVTQSEVFDGLDLVADAQRNYNLASSLLASLRRRDPNIN